MGGGLYQFERTRHDRNQARLICHLMRVHKAAARLAASAERVGNQTYRIDPGALMAVRAAVEGAEPAIRKVEEVD